MRNLLIGLAVAGLAAMPVAQAQQEQSFETKMLLTSQTCMVKTDSPEIYPALSVIAACEASIASMAAQNAVHETQVAATQDDRNIFRTLTVMNKIALTGAQGRADGKRSARSCQTAESAWLDARTIDPSQSPSPRSGFMSDAVANARKLVQICRNDFGAAPGAPPLY